MADTTDISDTALLSTQPEPTSKITGYGPFGWLRWAWRSLTSMRTALVLLFLLALAAVPGSIIPQRRLSELRVDTYYRNHPTLAPILNRIYLFDVFGSPWFAAIYLLLFVSLV